jgi:hypothetical protein
MNCESLPLLMNAALDEELSPARMDQHLAQCSACREQWDDLQLVHHDLTSLLKSPVIEPAVERVMASIQTSTTPARPTLRRGGNSVLALLAAVIALLIAVGTTMRWSDANVAVAEISLATGTIDYKPSHAREWITVDKTVRVALPASARVRTRSASLCEIRTTSDAIVRLNQQTELVLHRPEKVELVSGELWCRAAGNSELEVSCTPNPSKPGVTPVFTCPSSSEVQWRSLPDHAMACMDVASTPAEIKTPTTSRTIQPGEDVTFDGTQAGAEKVRHSNPMQATSWQLPLLVLRSPDDSELRMRLLGALQSIGQTKVSYMHEDQIRQLGPAGAIPLLAYVNSPESRQQVSLRQRAMRLASEMAAPSSLPEFEALLKDEDPIVREFANRALMRFQPSRLTPVLKG